MIVVVLFGGSQCLRVGAFRFFSEAIPGITIHSQEESWRPSVGETKKRLGPFAVAGLGGRLVGTAVGLRFESITKALKALGAAFTDSV